MNHRLVRHTSLAMLVMMIIILVPLLLPYHILAQEPAPATTTPVVIVPGDEQSTEPALELVATPDSTVTATPADPDSPLQATAESATQTTIDEAGPAVSEPAQVQGPVRLDVTVSPNAIKSGETITYTYVMTNTTGSSVSPKVRLRWVDFNETDRNGIVQFCAVVGCPSENIQGGISVSSPEKLTVNGQTVYQYTAGNLAAGQSGRFSVRLRTRTDRYPVTGKEPTRPAGSGQLFLNDNFSSPVSEDTANTQIIGPVFVLSKAVSNTPPKVYPLETVEFTISLGNGTGSGDVINGRVRADAIDATNVKLVDTFPPGSEFVSAEGSPTVDTQRKTLTWQIARLSKGQTLTFKVRFKKSNVAQGCGNITNSTYSVTSPEMPIKSGNETYAVTGRAVKHPVITPLEIQSIVTDPGTPPYGAESRLVIKVRSFFNQPVNGLKLIYYVQSNAFYLPNSATPNPGVAPNGGTPGGQVEWIFNMPAASFDTPVTSEFSLRVRGGYTSTVANGSGVAQLVAPQNVPAACVESVKKPVNFQPRIVISKFTDVQPINGRYYAEQGESFPYTIEVKNQGVDDAIGLIVYDALPLQAGSNFSYVDGSGTINGQTREPDLVENGIGGRLQWEGLNLAAGETIRIAFQLRVEGNEFDEYCTIANAVLNDEKITTRSNKLCVKINPNFLLEKTVDLNTITNQPQAEVRFTLRLTNQSGQTYQVGLYDVPGSFSYISQVSGYATPTLNEFNHLEWPLVSLAPSQQIEAVIRMRLPNECITKDYVNEAQFLFVGNDGSTYRVATVPRTEVKVRHNCGTNRIEYSAKADRAVVSLQDRVKYTLSVKNLNTTTELRDIDVTSILPEGFRFEGMTTEGQVRSNPQIITRPDGRIKLVWRISQLAANTTSKIIFNARSGDIVGDFDSWTRATAPNLLEAVCKEACTTPLTDEGETLIYSRGITAVKPLHTALPEITEEDSCANPDDERIYSLSLINTNNHPYASTAVTLTLPLGLHLKDVLGTAPSRIIYERDGRTSVIWNDLTIPAKPANASSALVKLQVQLQVGRAWNDLATQAQVTSVDGTIPRQDGINDPTVKMCIDGPAMAKDASKLVIDPDEEFLYQISAVNPESQEITMNIEDILPRELTYISQVSGPNPTRTGNQLTWNNVRIPAANGDNPGRLNIRFRVKLTGGNAGDFIPNTATISGATSQVDTTYNTVEVEIRRRSNVYLPLIKK